MSVLAIRSLSKTFGGVRAVNDVSFEIAQGEFLAMIGPNGAGKSTCFNMINGQLTPDSGQILFAGRDIAGLASREVWRLGVGRTFQVAATFSSMTVIENVQMALISYARENYHLWRPASERHRDRALDLLTQVGMREAAERPSRELAYGDVKRVELAIALANEPAKPLRSATIRRCAKSISAPARLSRERHHERSNAHGRTPERVVWRGTHSL